MSLEAMARVMQQALAERGRSYALAGGLAVSVRTEPRFTRDIDLVVATDDDDDAESLIRSLRSAGIVPFTLTEQEATGRLAMARLRDGQGMVCDLLLANTGIEDRILATAESLEVFRGVELPVATTEALIAMKTLSARPDRPQDALDLTHLFRDRPDLDEVRDLLRAIEAAGCHRRQDLQAKLADLLTELGSTPP